LAEVQQVDPRRVARELGKDARLLSIDAASIVKYDEVVSLWIPVAVSDDPKGRETVYDLPQDEKTLMGIYVTGTRIVKEFFTRHGDREYEISQETPSGEVLYTGKGDLEVINESIGYGRIRWQGTREGSAKRTIGDEPDPAEGKSIWIVWSGYKKHED
jgi:hypothetical protein